MRFEPDRRSPESCRLSPSSASCGVRRTKSSRRSETSKMNCDLRTSALVELNTWWGICTRSRRESHVGGEGEIMKRPRGKIAAAFVLVVRQFAPPRRLVRVNKRPMYIHVTEGKRAVLFESRIGASCLSWIQMQPSVAEFSRAVSYELPKTRVEYQVMACVDGAD